MAIITSLTIGLLIVSIFFGQVFRFPLASLNIPLVDLFHPILAALFVYHFITATKINKIRILKKPLVYFLLWTVLTYALGCFRIKSIPLPSLFYLLRLLSFGLLFLIPPPALLQKHLRLLQQLFILSLFSLVLFGLLQYFFWPNLTPLSSLNWDPHLNRLVSTYLDPAYTGLILTFFLLTIFFNQPLIIKSSLTKFNLLLATYLSLAFTYSRASFLALLSTGIFHFFKTKNYLPFQYLSILIVITTIILPRPPGEGTRLERTASILAKIENYKIGINLWSKSPIFGHGYNLLSTVRLDQPPTSHSANGFDSSLVTILTTTGIVGLLLYLSALRNIFLSSSPAMQYLLCALFIHSFFTNSLLYPHLLSYLIILKTIWPKHY